MKKVKYTAVQVLRPAENKRFQHLIEEIIRWYYYYT